MHDMAKSIKIKLASLYSSVFFGQICILDFSYDFLFLEPLQVITSNKTKTL